MLGAGDNSTAGVTMACKPLLQPSRSRKDDDEIERAMS